MEIHLYCLLTSHVYRSNGRQTVGDGAFITDMTPSVIAVCHMEGTDSMYYYSTTFSGGPGVSTFASLIYLQCADCDLCLRPHCLICAWDFIRPPSLPFAMQWRF